MPTLTLEENRPQATERGVSPSVMERVLSSVVHPEVSRSPYSLTSIRGIQEDRHLGLESVIRGSSFAQDHRDQISKIWVEARVDSRSDQGRDLRELIPTLERDPQLLSSLYKIATSDSLFGQKRTVENAESFDKMRREYLGELIRGAVDSRAITQGPGAMCTAASMLKALPPAELLRLGAGFALDGHVKTLGGKEMVMRPEFVKRAELSSSASIEDVKCRRPSAGMLMLLDGVIELGVRDTTAQQGSYWWQYTDAWRNLRGHESVCAARDAKIQVDASGQAVSTGGVSTVSTMDYLVDQLRRNKSDGAHGGVLIDTEWDHSSRSTGSESMHARHMLKAVALERRNGSEYIVCENPIGDFVDVAKSYKGHAEFMPPGTILGNKNGFWFETGEKGTVYIRKDVLDKHLQTVLVDYKDAFVASSGKQVQGIGTLSRSEDGPINFVNGDEPAKRAEQRERPIESSGGPDRIEKAPEMRAPKRENAPDFHRGSSSRKGRRGDEGVDGESDATASLVDGSRDRGKERLEEWGLSPRRGESSVQAVVIVPPTEVAVGSSVPSISSRMLFGETQAVEAKPIQEKQVVVQPLAVSEVVASESPAPSQKSSSFLTGALFDQTGQE